MTPRKSLSPEARKSYKGRKIPNFCRNVLARRQELGMTQDDLAEKVGTAKPRISELEGGKFPRSEERIIAIARALKTDPNTLLGFTPDG